MQKLKQRGTIRAFQPKLLGFRVSHINAQHFSLLFSYQKQNQRTRVWVRRLTPQGLSSLVFSVTVLFAYCRRVCTTSDLYCCFYFRRKQKVSFEFNKERCQGMLNYSLGIFLIGLWMQLSAPLIFYSIFSRNAYHVIVAWEWFLQHDKFDNEDIHNNYNVLS